MTDPAIVSRLGQRALNVAYLSRGCLPPARLNHENFTHPPCGAHGGNRHGAAGHSTATDEDRYARAGGSGQRKEEETEEDRLLGHPARPADTLAPSTRKGGGMGTQARGVPAQDGHLYSTSEATQAAAAMSSGGSSSASRTCAREAISTGGASLSGSRPALQTPCTRQRTSSQPRPQG